MQRARVGERGQAVIPKTIREALGIKPGQDIVFTLHGKHAHVSPARPGDGWRLLWDRMPGFELPADYDIDTEIEQAMREAGHGGLR